MHASRWGQATWAVSEMEEMGAEQLRTPAAQLGKTLLPPSKAALEQLTCGEGVDSISSLLDISARRHIHTFIHKVTHKDLVLPATTGMNAT